jgi:Ran GTPase-activating protein (RanGAP) involved in mRNA processing and transport
MGKSFGSGLVRSTCSGLKLDLAGQVAGHRPTSIAAISQLMLGVMSMDLSQNCITIEELKILAKALQNSATLLELSLAKNYLGDEGAAILSAHIAESKLMSLNLFGSGIKEEGAKALASVISSSTSLTHLNLQYNAVRGETKKMLEAANAARVPQLVLVL